MTIELSTEEIKELRRIQKKDRFHRRRFIKATVLLMLHQGLSMEDIQMSLTLDDNTIGRYVRGYQERGLKRYMEDGYIPYCGKLTNEQEKALSLHLDEYLYEDAASICEYVKEQFGVSYTISGMRDLLHRLGFVYKQTKAVAQKADEQAQLNFLEETLPKLLEEVQDGQSVMYFSDGCHPTYAQTTS